jgi:hypothetical protein
MSLNALELAGGQVFLAASDKDKGSPVGLFVVLVLCVAVYFLYRSLSKHLRRVPDTFDPPVKIAPDEHEEQSKGQRGTSALE